MPKKLGNDLRVWIESSTAGTFNEILGQQDVSVDGNQNFIDTSTKDTGQYATQAPAQRTTGVQLSLVPDYPDANGYGRLLTLYGASSPTPFRIQLREAPFAIGNIVFDAPVYLGSFNRTGPQNGVRGCSVSFGLAGAPTVDTL